MIVSLSVSLRFLLGATEGCVTAGKRFIPDQSTVPNIAERELSDCVFTKGVMLVCSMFYTRTEIGERISW